MEYQATRQIDSAANSWLADESGLIQAAQTGDNRSFEALAVRYRGLVLEVCRRYRLQSADAADVAQDVFIKALRGLPRCEADLNFGAWLRRIAENACKDFIRRRETRQSHFVPIASDMQGRTAEPAGRLESPEQALRRTELRERLNMALARLSPTLRETFELKEVHGLRYAAVAARLGCSEGTVKSRIFRAREFLMAQLGELLA
jgi:RNA polymerase sigma-70 factor, ECF subfamily